MLWSKGRKNKKNEKEKAGSGKKTAAAAPASGTRAGAAAQSGTPPGCEQALDFLAEVLRLLGEYAFDLEDTPAERTRTRFDTWARHLLVGVTPPDRPTPEPGDEDGDGGEAKEDPAPQRRDLPGLRRFVTEHRQHEAGYVTTSLANLREAIWTFIHGLRRGLSADQASDREVAFRMRRLEQAVRSDDSGRIKNEANETVSLLGRLLSERGDRQREQVRALAERLGGLRQKLDSARQQASVDGLTGLYNRAAFDEQIERELDFATLFGRKACLLMLDIDHFKWVNDNHGHRCGDEVLRRAAGSLSRSFMRKDDFVARYGGEEFAIVLREVGAEMASQLAERCLAAMRDMEIDFEEAKQLRISASIGVAELRRGEGSAHWIERADQALYSAKQAGRDRVATDPGDLP